MVKSTNWQILFNNFKVDLVFRPWSGDPFLFENPRKFFFDRFWFVRVTFFRMAKFYSLALISRGSLTFSNIFFFTPAITEGLSLEYKRQQVSSGLQDSPQYSGWSQQCCNLIGLDSSSDF